MKYGDKFYIITSNWCPSDKQKYYIQEMYYISDVVYFNGKKTVELCPKTLKEIEDNGGRWYGWKKEYDFEQLNSTKDVSGRYNKWFDSLEKARKYAKYALSEEELVDSKSFFPSENNQYNIFKKYDKIHKGSK